MFSAIVSADPAKVAGGDNLIRIDVDALADDPRLLKQFLREALQVLKEKQERIDELTHMVRQLQRWRFGQRSEKVPHEQLLFAFVRAFDVPERLLPAASLEPAATAPSAPAPRKRAARPHGRRVVPADLPKERVVVDLPEGDKECRQCGEDLIQIGQDVSQQLDVKPPELVVRETVRPRYACHHCEGHGVAIADLPPASTAIPRCLAAPGLLAWTIVQKYQFHVPLYRQSQIYRSQGVDLPDSTLGGWIGQCGRLLQPVHTAMKKDILDSEVMNTDDSPMRVLDPTLRHRTREGRLYTHLGDARHRHVVYEFSPNHQHHWAQDFLENYRGFLQADAWKGYDKLFNSGRMVEVGCMAHARRYFFDAKEADSERALVALAYIHRLYEIEEGARNLSPQERRRMREAYALPILGAFKTWIEQQALAVLPRNPMAEALGYAQGQWRALCRYCEDGRLSIDNNASERALRGPVLGKKNWMFFGSDDGGRWAAILYSLVESAKVNGHNPFEYLRDAIARIATHPFRRILELTPAYWRQKPKPRDGPNTS